MVQPPDHFSSSDLLPVGARAHYVASGAHYEMVARRIVASLRDSARSMVLVTGDPPADPRVLSEALGNAAGPGYAVVIISCGPELKREDLDRAILTLAKPKAGVAAAEPGCSASTSPLFVFDNLDRLSDRQIEEVYKDTQRRDRLQPAAVLLAPLDFPARLERPSLQFVKQRIAAQFRFHEVGDDEAIAVLHDQLLAQRDRRVEARGFRRGMLIGSAAGGVAIVASLGVFILHSTTEQVHEAPAGPGHGDSQSAGAPRLRPAGEATRRIVTNQSAPKADASSAPATAPPSAALAASPPPPPSTPALAPLAAPHVSPPKATPSAAVMPAPPAATVMPVPPTVAGPTPLAASALAPPIAKVANQLPTGAPPAPAHPPTSPGLSGAEITELLVRGDAFLGTGDIISARLCYERAANADSGVAALRLGTTFDPIVLGRAEVQGIAADPVQALSWYRRARELGVVEAEQRIKALEYRRLETDTRPR